MNQIYQKTQKWGGSPVSPFLFHIKGLAKVSRQISVKKPTRWRKIREVNRRGVGVGNQLAGFFFWCVKSGPNLSNLSMFWPQNSRARSLGPWFHFIQMLLFGDFFYPETYGNSTTKMRNIFSKWLQPATRVDVFCRSHEGIRDFHSHRFSRVKSPSRICLFCVFFPIFQSKLKKQRKITYLPIPNRLFVCLFVLFCLLIFLLFQVAPVAFGRWLQQKMLKQLGMMLIPVRMQAIF